MSKRKIITMPNDLVELIEKSMKKTKSTFSEWMRDAAREKLGLAVILALCLMACDSVMVANEKSIELFLKGTIK